VYALAITESPAPCVVVSKAGELVQRSIDFGHRIESFSVDYIERRLARTLIRFAERLGQNAEDGSVGAAIPLSSGWSGILACLPFWLNMNVSEQHQ